jgi:hypothetical protein
MKKILGIMLIAGALVSCDNSGSNDAKNDSLTKDSVVVTPDTATVVVPDTTVNVDTANRAAGDTSTKK